MTFDEWWKRRHGDTPPTDENGGTEARRAWEAARSDASPGTPLAFIGGLFDFAERECGHNPLSARPALTTVTEWVATAKRQLDQYGEVVQRGKRLPAPDLDQDPAFAAFVLGKLEKRIAELESALGEAIRFVRPSTRQLLKEFSDTDGADEGVHRECREIRDTRRRLAEILDPSGETLWPTRQSSPARTATGT